MNKQVHVTYQKQDGMWHVIGANNKGSKSYRTQKEAIVSGKKLAMETACEFAIHGRDGKIRQSLSYGNDPSNSMKYKRKSTSSTRGKTRKRSS